MAAIMSQNGRKMAKMLHNAAKKFDWAVTEDISKIPRYCMRRANWARYTAMTASLP